MNMNDVNLTEHIHIEGREMNALYHLRLDLSKENKIKSGRGRDRIS